MARYILLGRQLSSTRPFHFRHRQRPIPFRAAFAGNSDRRKPKRIELTVGIAVRNEESALPDLCRSLRDALAELPPHYHIELLFCTNGTTDQSEDIIAAELASGFQTDYATLLRSEEGKLRAQSTIVEQRKYCGDAIFLDADCVIDRFCLAELCRAAEIHTSEPLINAEVWPIAGSLSGVLGYLQHCYYSMRSALSQQRYFHGRAFLLRNPERLLRKIMQNLREDQVALSKRPDLSHLALRTGPVVDDIAMSRQLCHDHGPAFMVRVPGAITRFAAARSIFDLYLAELRVATELERLDLLCPEHRTHQVSTFRRRIIARELWKWPWAMAAGFLAYHTLTRVLRGVAQLRLFLARLGYRHRFRIWAPLLTTKRQKTG